jgi:ABC-type transport system substrate-binding protein
MGVELQGVIPEGIFGYQGGPEGINPNVFEWNAARGRPQRKSLDHARRLLAEAGYPGGVGSDGRPLVVNYDNAATGGGADAYFRWLHRQFGKLGITVVNRTTDSSTFAAKADEGKVQMFGWGWLPDYPDPENFLFLLYGPNGQAKYHGPNSANYENEEYDRLFRKMLTMPNSPERHQAIQKMHAILHQDLPWFSTRQEASFSLAHGWVKNSKINVMAWNANKYVDIDVEARERYRRTENQPIRWPIYATACLLLVMAWPALRRRMRKEQG